VTAIRVLIADDQELVRSGLALILEAEPDIDVVAEASNGVQAIDEATRLHPDVVLMDVRMPGLDGVEATRTIIESWRTHPRAQQPVRVLMLTTYNDTEAVYRALRAGASGFLLKDCPATELVSAVRVVASGSAMLAPSVTWALIQEFASRPDEHLPVPEQVRSLTAKEREVLDLMAQAQSNTQIATHLGISEGTVKTHVGHILDKLGAHDRTHAVVIAYQCRLVPVNSDIQAAPPRRPRE
jgi:DNA-binding NarL/FixJ family response regulator